MLNFKFQTNIPLLFAAKTLVKRRFSDAFRGYRSETLVKNGLNNAISSIPILFACPAKINLISNPFTFWKCFNFVVNSVQSIQERHYLTSDLTVNPWPLHRIGSRAFH